MAVLQQGMLFIMLWIQLTVSISNCQVYVTRETWGIVYDPLTKSNQTVIKYTLSNSNKVQVQIISFGASITSVIIPDGKGVLSDIVLGFDNMAGMFF